jgi:hypothetical protein
MAGAATARLATTTALHQRVANRMAALQTTEKKAVEACTRVRDIVLLLEEEHASATALEAEVAAVALQLAPTTPTLRG